MRTFATGVVIVTVEVGGRLSGLTINSCCSISTSPPQILISLAHGASCREPLLASGGSGSRSSAPASASSPSSEPCPAARRSWTSSARTPTTPARRGSPAPSRTSTAPWRATFEVSDHTLVIGAVERALVGRGAEVPGEPLLYFDRTFHRLGEPL